MLYWYYQEERGTGMAYAKAIELNSDDVEYLQSLVFFMGSDPNVPPINQPWFINVKRRFVFGYRIWI